MSKYVRNHVSPNIYLREMETAVTINESSVDSLGVVGETVKGPAFQPIKVKDWDDFVTVFGGTKPEKYKKTNYPRYELPYIAQSYLSEAKEIKVCRVLGMSGYNAGPAWAITAPRVIKRDNNGNPTRYDNIVVAVIRSRGFYDNYTPYVVGDGCNCQNGTYDKLRYYVGEMPNVSPCSHITHYNPSALTIVNYYEVNSTVNACSANSLKGNTNKGNFLVTETDFGRFTLEGLLGSHEYGDNGDNFSYSVSLNEGDSNFILKVLGTDPQNGEAPIYVESLYDVALRNEISKGNVDRINSGLTFYDACLSYDFATIPAVDGLLYKGDGELKKHDVGKRYLYANDLCESQPYHIFNIDKDDPNILVHSSSSNTMEDGVVYTVREYAQNNKKSYVYGRVTDGTITGDSLINFASQITETSPIKDNSILPNVTQGGFVLNNSVIVLNKDDGFYYTIASEEMGKIVKQLAVVDKATKSSIQSGTIKKTSLSEAKYTIYYYDKKTGDLTRTQTGYSKFYTTSSIETNVKNAIVKTGATFAIEGKKIRGKSNSLYINDPNHLTMVGTLNGKREKVKILDTATEYAVMDGCYVTEWKDSIDEPYYAKLTSVSVTSNLADKELGNNYYFDEDDKDPLVLFREKYWVTYVETVQSGCLKVTCDLNNYKTQYRNAVTPWVVSNVTGDLYNMNMTKLFRFYTINDGDDTNKNIKISISNIQPNKGLFTVQVRYIFDTDDNPYILETFNNCSLIPNTPNYIGYLIGTEDGQYESKSNYITVEVNETLITENSFPCGFLGYPTHHYNGVPMIENSVLKSGKERSNTDSMIDVVPPSIEYNTVYDINKPHRKQYFGLSNISGVDVDMFTFKGVCAYDDDPLYLTNSFHLDCRVDKKSYVNNDELRNRIHVFVDGIDTYVFDSVSVNNTTEKYKSIPIMDKEENMTDCIYENVNLRKFTLFFYGGFDGWDKYRQERSLRDNFMLDTYKGVYDKNSGEGFSFTKMNEKQADGLETNAFTSDWYAFLKAYKMFNNQHSMNINLFATPGIDLINSPKLCGKVIDIMEEDRMDCLYIPTMADKPIGAGDSPIEMYTPDSIVDFLDEYQLHTSYAATYYPWVKYADIENNTYIYLPPTKDVVRNIASMENSTSPWLAPAGYSRGKVECKSAKYQTSLEDEDLLYENGVNPIKTFAFDGVKVWGQKTMYEDNESLFSRLNVRLLLNNLKKQIVKSCIGIIFEPNDEFAESNLREKLSSILSNAKTNRGLNDYKIEIDNSIEARERYELPCTIWVKPTTAIEYIPIDFILTQNGVEF